MNTLIMTTRLNDIDPKAWLADLFARIADHPQTRLHELLPWAWKPQVAKPIGRPGNLIRGQMARFRGSKEG
jgi:hypothetical protein